MTSPSLEVFRYSSEWTHAELKAARSALPKSVFESVSAFANTRGGWIRLGITQDGDCAEGELVEAATWACLPVRSEGARQVSRTLGFYNLEAILAVGFRGRSHRGTQFHIWATAPRSPARPSVRGPRARRTGPRGAHR